MEDKERLYVQTIADCGSITKASEQLYIAQPSLTQALQRIESYYGAPFFFRGKNGLTLTDAGSIYLDVTGQMEQIYQQMKEEISASSRARYGSITLGTTPIQGGVLLPDFLKRYHDRFPNMHLLLTEGTSVELEQMIAEGKVDLALLHRPFKNHDLSYISIYKEPLLLAVSPDDEDWKQASAGKKQPYITAELMARKPFVLPFQDGRVRQLANNIFARLGISPKISFVTTNVITSIAMASQGMGLAVVPRYLVNVYQKKFGFETFHMPLSWNAKWEMTLAYKNGLVLPRQYKELSRILQETVAAMPEVFE